MADVWPDTQRPRGKKCDCWTHAATTPGCAWFLPATCQLSRTGVAQCLAQLELNKQTVNEFAGWMCVLLLPGMQCSAALEHMLYC